MKVAVAGGTGFLGRHVVAALEAAGHEAVILARGSGAGRRCDVGTGPVPRDVVAGCDGIVNLVGIKREEGESTFERAHVQAVENLVAAAREAKVGRFVHVSVAGNRRGPADPYMDTKARGEEVVRASGLAYTILAPGLVWGHGDDMLTSLVRAIRHAPVFPVPAGPPGPLQIVTATDVARAVVASLERPGSIGKRYDVVGPERLVLPEIVRRVAGAIELPTWVVPVPVTLLRLGAGAMERAMRAPIVTRSQVAMLVRGLAGDPEPARNELGIEPAAMTVDAVREIEGSIPPLARISLRLVESRDHRRWLERQGEALGPQKWLAPAGVAAVACLPRLVPNIWASMVLANIALIVLTLGIVRLPWRELARPRLGHIMGGLIAAAVLYALGAVTLGALTWLVPAISRQNATLLAWRSEISPLLALPALLVAILGEEIFWRAGIALPLAARFGPWRACLAAAALYGLAHVGVGPPLLVLAAFGAGLFWGWLLIKTRSLVPVLISHLVWDVLVIFAAPY